MAVRRQFEKLSIRGFRGISALNLDRLGTLNILLGANDVGKTSILETVFLICNLSEPRLPVRVQNRRNYMVQDIDDLKSIFFELNLDKTVEIETYSREHYEHRKLSISAPYADSYADEKSTRMAGDASDQSVNTDRSKDDDQSSSVVYGSRVLQYNSTIRSALLDSPMTIAVRLVDRGDKWGVVRDPEDSIETDFDSKIPAKYMRPYSGYDTDRIGRVVVSKRDERLLKYLREINPRVTKISVLGDVAYLDIGMPEMMPLNMFGSGMIRAAMILSECILSDVEVLLIDEIEYGLHYQAMAPLLAALLRLSEERSIQVFASTHSIDVLQRLQEVLRAEDSSSYRNTTTCYTIQRDKAGLVQSYRYDYEQFDHCIQHAIEIR